MSPFFSIIIPVYNVAPYLRECLDSVLVQTFTDWEAICVDDGSTDDSGEILDEYAGRDCRLKVFHQSNAGVSVARNMALDGINGLWFLFLDSDDLLRKDALEMFFPYTINNNYDGILVQPYVPYWDGKIIPKRIIKTQILIQNATKEDLVFGPYAANGFVISRIYRTSIFKRLRFCSGVKIAEDVRFWFDALCIPAKWTILKAEYYLYRQRKDSVCGQKNPNDCEAVLNSVLYACGKISEEMGLGVSGVQRYIDRWPYFPSEYLSIFVARHAELDDDVKSKLFVQIKEITRLYGSWPFSKRLNYSLWLIEHHLGILLPVFRCCVGVHTLFSRGKKLQQYVHENGMGFALGKIKRQFFHQGEYKRNTSR